MATATSSVIKPDHEASRKHFIFNDHHDQLRESIALARAHQPLPANARVPSPSELLHVEPLRRAITAPAGR